MRIEINLPTTIHFSEVLSQGEESMVTNDPRFNQLDGSRPMMDVVAIYTYDLNSQQNRRRTTLLFFVLPDFMTVQSPDAFAYCALVARSIYDLPTQFVPPGFAESVCRPQVMTP